MAKTETTSPTQSQLSLAEIKDLITFARKERLAYLILDGLRFQFMPGAHEPDTPARPAPAEQETTPFGHYRPE